MDAVQKSYQKHTDWYEGYKNEAYFRRVTSVFDAQNEPGAQAVARLYAPIDPFCHQPYSWLTIGDGKFGSDAHYILHKGATSAMATDISTALLEYAAEKEFIRDYSAENAESLSFADDAFDFVLCKESFHHFPRPFIALSEMLRVARKGVLLIEPQDVMLANPLLLGALNFVDFIYNATGLDVNFYRNRYSFEPVGNFVYKISKREIEKAALGVGLRWVTFKSFFFFYDPSIDGVETSPIKAFNQRAKHSFATGLAKLGLLPYNMLACAIFKDNPAENLRNSLLKSGFSIRNLPKNPYA